MAGNAFPLQCWLVVVAVLRIFSVYIGIFDVDKFRIGLFNGQPDQVTALHGRTFATWTMLSCTLCLVCARSPSSQPIYAATLASFLLALVHLGSETVFFETATWRGGLAPMIIAGVSSLWMALGYSYYTSADNTATAVEKKAE